MIVFLDNLILLIYNILNLKSQIINHVVKMNINQKLCYYYQKYLEKNQKLNYKNYKSKENNKISKLVMILNKH